MPRIQRTDYSDGTAKTTHGDNELDFDNYFIPRSDGLLANTHLWGVAGGLTVSVASGHANQLVVSAGLAVDAGGRLIYLAPGGVALFDKANTTPPPPDKANPKPLTDNGLLTFPVPAGAAGTWYLTVQFFEYGIGSNPALVLQAPWVRLQSDRPDPATGLVIVLATATVAAGSVTALSGDDRDVLGLHAGRLEIRRARTSAGADGVDTAAVGALSGNPDGGLDISTVGADGSSRTAISLRDGGDVVLAGDAGHVTVGVPTGAPQRSLHVHGDGVHVDGSEPELSFANWGSDDFVEAPQQGERWSWRAQQGTATLWSGSDRLSVDVSSRGGGLDVARPMRVRQGGDAGAGIWLSQGSPGTDRAFVGMADDDHVGLGGSTGQFGLTMHADSGLVEVGGTADLTSVTPRLYVRNSNPHPPAHPVSAGIACDVAAGTGLNVKSPNGVGLYAFGGAFAAQLEGDVHVTGNLHIDGTVTKNLSNFVIDHPLAPADKLLCHAAVESDEMKNVYDGEVTADDAGEAVIAMPAWFEALNHRFRYQLTPIGSPAPNLHVAEELTDGRFRIAGAPARCRICWQVTGIRQDSFARTNPLVVELDKSNTGMGARSADLQAARRRHHQGVAEGVAGGVATEQGWGAADQ